MTTTVFLVRHAVHSTVDRVLVGRDQQVGLNSEGFRQAARLAEYFSHFRIAMLYSSPQLRARQTAQVIAEVIRKPFLIAPQIDEIDVGDWTGRSFAELASDPRWRRWNCDRSSASVPNGECMHQVQERVCRHLTHVAAIHQDRHLVMVTHAEVIRAAILRFRGRPLQDYVHVPIDPASVGTLLLHEDGGEVARENQSLTALVAA